MAHANDYLPLQILLLFAVPLLSAEDKLATEKNAGSVRIVSGPGKILDISKQSSVNTGVSRDADKDINDLLYQVYKKVRSKKSSDSGAQLHGERYHKGLIVDESANDVGRRKIAKKVMSEEAMKKMKQVKKGSKMQLKQLEETIDKLITSLSKVSKDGKVEVEKVNKGIADMSKFADNLNSHAEENPVNNDGAESFEDFKGKFFDTFVKAEKKQSIVYHGKKDTPRIVYHGKDHNTDKRLQEDAKTKGRWLSRDEMKKEENNLKKDNAKQHDHERDQHDQYQADQHDQYQHDQYQHDQYQHDQYQHKDANPTMVKKIVRMHNDIARVSSDNSISEERMKELADLYNALKKQTALETRKRNVASLAPVKQREDDRARNAKIQQVKKDLTSLLDLISNNNIDASAKTVKKDSLHHRDNAGYVSGRNLNQYRKDYVSEDQHQLKRRLLSLVRTLEDQLKHEEGQQQRGISNKINDSFESDLDSITDFGTSKGTINNYAKKTENSFVDALKGFIVAAKTKKITQ